VKIFLLGATGNSGRRILGLALQRAHEVTAVVRDETRLLSVVDRPIPPNLHVFIGDASKSADIARVMVGHDVAINAAGQVTEGSTFTQLVQTGAGAFAALVHGAGVARVQPILVN
jgi:putative NADH-flavin reductase